MFYIATVVRCLRWFIDDESRSSKDINTAGCQLPCSWAFLVAQIQICFLVFKDVQEETHKQTERRRHLGFDQGRQWMSSKEDNWRRNNWKTKKKKQVRILLFPRSSTICFSLNFFCPKLEHKLLWHHFRMDWQKDLEWERERERGQIPTKTSQR